MNDKSGGDAFIFLLVIAICMFCAYWLAKNLSYWFWYEDMVKETIKELVKQAALK